MPRLPTLARPVQLLPLLILILGGALRAYRLDGQSLWYDEGVSAFMTTRGPVEIARAAAADIHPPLYYWLLAAWAAVFGDGENSLRGLSVLFGTLTIWVVWRLGRRLYGDAVGLTAAALLAVAPLAVQYGQEVRMYALAGLLAAATTWAYVATWGSGVRGQRSGVGKCHPGLKCHPERSEGSLTRRAVILRSAQDDTRSLAPGPWPLAPLVYGLLAAALLYTHYYGLLVLVVHQLHLLLRVARTRELGVLGPWLLGSGLTAALYLPWLSHAIRQTGHYPGLGTPQPPWALAVDAVNVLSIGLATTRFAVRWGLAPFVALALVGLATAGPCRPGPAKHTAGARALLALWLGLPIAVIIALSTTRPLYEPRFLMLVLPAWVTLVAAGIVALGTAASRWVAARESARRAPIAGALVAAVLLAMLVPTVRSLGSYYFDPVYARDDYRALARQVGGLERPGDAVVLTAPGQVEIFSYYYDGQADLVPLPAQRPIDVADTLARLESLTNGHSRVWLVRWAVEEADPGDLIGRWFETHARPAGAQRFGAVELRLYELTVSAGVGCWVLGVG